LCFKKPSVEVKKTSAKIRKPTIFWRALFIAYKGKLIVSGLMKVVHDLLQFCGPLILKYSNLLFVFPNINIDFLIRQILNFLNDSKAPTWVGIFYAILIGATVFCQTLFLQAYFHRTYCIGLRFRSAITGLVYRKVNFVCYT